MHVDAADRAQRSPDAAKGWGEHRQAGYTILDDYDRASVAADCVCLTVVDNRVHVVCWRRTSEPEADRWALPGVFVNYMEEPSKAAARALVDKAGITTGPPVRHVATVNDPLRDERGWIVSLVFVALIPSEIAEAVVCSERTALGLVDLDPGDDPESVGPIRVELEDQDGLGLGHDALVRDAFLWLRQEVNRQPVHLELLPARFTLTEMQLVHEAILNRSVNRDSFRRMVHATREWVAATGQHRRVRGRAVAELYQGRPTASAT